MRIYKSLGYQQITSLSSSTGLTMPTDPNTGSAAKPTHAFIIAESQAVRWRDDRTAPTATVGMPLAVGDILEYDGDLNAIRFFEQAASAKLNVSYFIATEI